MKNIFIILLLLTFLSCKEKVSNEPKYPIGVIKTSLGDMYFWLYEETPKHMVKFIELSRARHYNQFTINRVVKNFVIQGGCPDSVQYFKDSPFLLDPEFNDSIKHIYGALGMGRNDNPGKQSNACQLYVVNKEEGLPNLDGNYMIFGILIKGKEVLENIEEQKTNSSDKPLTVISMEVKTLEYTEKELENNFSFKIPN